MSQRLCIAALLLIVAASSVEASIQRLDPVDGYDCAGAMTTDNCFGPTVTGSTGPVATSCVAMKGQKCRDCMQAYDIWGQEQPYKTCNYVRRNAACDCTPAGSSQCTASTASTCTYLP